jgi:ribonuclease T
MNSENSQNPQDLQKIVQKPENILTAKSKKHPMAERFRGYYPVVIDVETGGLEAEKNPLLEIAAVFLTLNSENQLVPLETMHYKILPDPRCEINEKSLKINKINIETHILSAIPEEIALKNIFGAVRKAIKKHQCVRGILVGHNAHFDLAFMHAALARHGIKRDPFHPFSVIDTVSLSAFAYGQTTLKAACKEAGIEFDEAFAHTAVYDAEKTAELLCRIHNKQKS